MRFFIRNKTKYDPSVAFTDPVITVNVDHTQEITKIKEEARKVGKACKITALYVARQDGSFVDLADDRTINYYNLQDDTILETTSNPFWVTTLYSNMRRREQEAASNPEDARLCFQAQKSYIHRCMAIGLLLNGTGETEKQPATFHALEDLYEYCLNQGKKPAYMSQFTLEELQEMFEAYQEEHQNHRDPIGSFIYSQAVKLGYLQDNNTIIDSSDPFRSHFEQYGEQQRDVPARRNGGQNRNARAGGRRRANRNRTCDDCEVAIAISYCADCNPPLCLCDTCWRSLHRGATRKNHQMKDISEAPTPTTYTPQAYRAPFAMLVAFHRALQEQPQKLSLTAEDIKTRAQPFTDTDLEEAKKRGKPFSGFDSLENALMKHDIVLKEAAATPKYSLLDTGKELALKCSNFDYAMQALLRQAEVPTVPVPAMRPAVFDNRQVCLLVDTEEPQKDRFVKVARERGLSARVRKLPSGDFCWILLPPGAAERDVPEQELVLPYLVERKTWDDLWSSVRSPRFENQVQRMKACGIQNLFYLVEGSPKDISGRPGPEVETFLKGKLDRLLLEDKFFVNRTPSWLKTVEWLCHLTNLAIACQQARGRKQWMTFAEFSRKANSVPAAPIARNAKPVSGIVWPASAFANNIKSHHKRQRDLGSNLDHVPQLSDSILIIQGLTAYNTTCNSHLKRALADYLKLPGQTAEECVQIHLEDYTDQLISVNVFQYYVLYLEVFKGVRIFRTETDEETQEFLSRFGANGTVVKCDQEAGYDANRPNDQPVTHAANRDEDMLFANDSQEEEFMLNQALQQSLVDPHNNENVDYFGHDNGVDDVDNGMNDNGGGGAGGSGGGSSVGDSGGSGSSGGLGGNSSTGGGSGVRGNSSSSGGWGSSGGNGGDGTRKPTRKPNIQPLFNQEHKPTKQPDTNNHVDKNDNKSNTREVPKEPVQKVSTSTVTVKQETEEEENDLENILQFKFYDSLKSHSNDEDKEGMRKSKHDSEDNKLHKIMEESHIQHEKEEEERKALLRSVYDEEEELRIAIELSKKEMEQKNIKGFEEIGQDRISNAVPSKNSASTYRNNSEGNNEEEDLLKVIELSKKDRTQNKMHGKEMGNLMGNCSGSDALFTSRENNTVTYHRYDDDEELRRVIELSKRDAEQKRLDTHNGKLNLQQGEVGDTSRNNSPSPNNFSDDDIQLKKVMELSKKEFQQNMQEISRTDPTLNSQDMEHEDCYYDLEVPDFANSGTHDDGVEFSSKRNDSSPSSSSKFSYQNSGGKYSNIDLKSSSSNSSLYQKKLSERSVDGLRKDDSGDEAVLVESQDVKDDDDGDDDGDDDIGGKFKKRFGNAARNSKEDKNSSSHYLKDDSDDSDDDNDIVKKFRERFGNAASNSKGDKNYNSHNNSTLPTDDAILVDSQEMEEDKTTAQKLQEGFDKETSHIETNKNGICSKNNSLSISFDDAILIDSQDEYTDEHIAQKLQEQFDKEGGRSRESHDTNQSSCFTDDTILVDSQDDIEVDSTSDFETALQLQKELNQQGNHSNTSDRPSSSTSSSTSSKLQRVNTREQISSYREEQQKKFRETKTGKAPKNMPPGLAFRQKAEAIARGKESLLAVVRPLGTTDSSTPRRKAEKRGHDGTIKNRFDDSQAGRKTARKSCPTTTSVHTETRNTMKNTSDASCLVFPASSSSPRPQEKDWRPSSRGRERNSSSSSSLVFPGSFSPPCGSGKQSTPKMSSDGAFSFPGSSSYSRDSSSSYQNNANSGFVFPSSSECPSSPSPRPSRDTSTSNASQSGFKPDDGLKGSANPTIINGPKCSDCGEIGHRKGTKRCPYYYTEEAQRKREEQARKRKEKREEEDRQMQTSIEALAAEQLQRAEQANQLRRQIEQLTQQNENLPKVVEDAMKYLKKRRKK